VTKVIHPKFIVARTSDGKYNLQIGEQSCILNSERQFIPGDYDIPFDTVFPNIRKVFTIDSDEIESSTTHFDKNNNIIFKRTNDELFHLNEVHIFISKRKLYYYLNKNNNYKIKKYVTYVEFEGGPNEYFYHLHYRSWFDSLCVIEVDEVRYITEEER
jgi:hypothetical protein